MDSLLALAPGPAQPVAPSVLRARKALASAIAAFQRVPDERLADPWAWRPEPGGDAEIRYAFYRAVERLEAAARDARREIDRDGADRPPASGIFAAATEARWDLHGLLAALGDAELDRDPGGGEWTLRQTLAHVVNVQRAYGSFSAWWLSRAGEPDAPARAPDDLAPDFPEEAADGLGTLRDVRERLDQVIDTQAGLLGGLNDDQVAAPARWAGYRVTVGFRLARMSSHLQEHTVQVEKTLAMLARTPHEVDRLVRLVHRAYGRVEGSLCALPPDLLPAAVHEIVDGALAEVVAVAEAVGGERPRQPDA